MEQNEVYTAEAKFVLGCIYKLQELLERADEHPASTEKFEEQKNKKTLEASNSLKAFLRLLECQNVKRTRLRFIFLLEDIISLFLFPECWFKHNFNDVGLMAFVV